MGCVQARKTPLALVTVGEWPLHVAAAVDPQPFRFRNGCAAAVSLLKPPPGFRSGLTGRAGWEGPSRRENRGRNNKTPLGVGALNAFFCFSYPDSPSSAHPMRPVKAPVGTFQKPRL
jgi:hypothetical protein